MKEKLEREFLIKYKNFKNFKEGDFKPYFDLCMKSLDNYKFFTYMKTCNDLNKIPPVKSFLLYYEKEVLDLIGDDETLDTYCKRGIGAFFGMLFKYVLGYSKQAKSIKITLNKRFKISTASVFTK